MRTFKNWKLLTIAGSAVVGAFYGLTMTLILNTYPLSLWAVIVPLASGSALGASAATALCRMYETCSLIRKGREFPDDGTLHYRGVRYLAFDLSMATDPQERAMTIKGSPRTARLTKEEFSAMSGTKNALETSHFKVVDLGRETRNREPEIV